MNSEKRIRGRGWLVAALLGLLLSSIQVEAAIDGINGPTFNLTASSGYISTPDGGSLLVWGYGVTGGQMQYPGPTLIVNQGDTVTVNLTNNLPHPVSIVFPGQDNVVAIGGTAGMLTQESTGPTDTVSYTFTATRPGTFQYYSGTRPELQTEMGLTGALIVRPSGTTKQAYNHPATAFDYEYLFLLSEMDPEIHYQVDRGLYDNIDTTVYHPVLWFINGRNGPDTLSPANSPVMPHQPYNIVPRTHPGDTILLRLIGASRDLHPFHTHGNNFTQIARDGYPMESSPGAGPDLGVSDYTLKVMPGGTYDALFTWTGKGLGWDIYSHAPSDPLAPNEDPADHGKPIPVVLPENQDLTFGGFWSGSPFLGAFGNLPPGEGGLNANGGMFFMWHSHTERELVNNDVFPGGMMTMLIVEPPGVPIQ